MSKAKVEPPISRFFKNAVRQVFSNLWLWKGKSPAPGVAVDTAEAVFSGLRDSPERVVEKFYCICIDSVCGLSYQGPDTI
jgi:hypothetical protein